MEKQEIFRKVALDRSSSPEQLDRLLPVTERRGWLALAALALLVLTGVGWGVLGSIPENVSGTGILVTSGGVLEVIPVAGGKITEVGAHVGDLVIQGQVLARMAQPELSVRLQQAKATLVDLEKSHELLVSTNLRDIPAQASQLAQQRAAVEQIIAGASSVRRASEAKIRSQRPLVAAGLLLKQQLLETQERRGSAIERFKEGQNQLAQIAVRELEVGNRRAFDEATSDQKVREARRGVADLAQELKERTEIVSPYTGRILEVLAEPGMAMTLGQPLLTLDLSGRGINVLEAVIFVPPSHGKQIRVGMPVQVGPTAIKREEHGMMLGRVTSVSDFPATIKGMLRVLKNDRLVSSLAGGDAPYEVHAELIPDPSTTSRYRWTSSKGPPQRIESGSLASARIAVARRRPIELVIPFAREHTGL
jgi:HlyD family secretion protein